MKIKVLFFLLLSYVSCCSAAETYDSYIQKLAVGVSTQEARNAKQTLEDAGEKAFPALIAHFNNPTPTPLSLGATSRKPTIGAICFQIFQIQIEGNWPKSLRKFYFLSPANAKQWIDAHQGLSLDQLRIAACNESLRLAEADLAARPSDFAQGAVTFLRERLESLKK